MAPVSYADDAGSGAGSERRTSGRDRHRRQRRSRSPATLSNKSASSGGDAHNDDQMSIDWTLNMRRKCCHFFGSSKSAESQRPTPVNQFVNHIRHNLTTSSTTDKTPSDIHYEINQDVANSSRLSGEETSASKSIRDKQHHLARALRNGRWQDDKVAAASGEKLATCYVNLSQVQLEARLKMQQQQQKQQTQLVDHKLDCQSDNLSALSASSSLLSLLLNSSLNQLFEIDNGTPSSRAASQSSTLCDVETGGEAPQPPSSRPPSEQLQSGPPPPPRPQVVDEKDLLIVSESTTTGGGAFHEPRFLRRRSASSAQSSELSNGNSSSSAATSGRGGRYKLAERKRLLLDLGHQRENSLASSSSTLSATRDLKRLQRQLEAATSSKTTTKVTSASRLMTTPPPPPVLAATTTHATSSSQVSIKRQFVTSCPETRDTSDSNSNHHKHNNSTSSVGQLLESLARLSLNDSKSSQNSMAATLEAGRQPKLGGHRRSGSKSGLDGESQELDKKRDDNSYKFKKVTRNLKLTPPPRVLDAKSESFPAPTGGDHSSGRRNLNDIADHHHHEAHHYNLKSLVTPNCSRLNLIDTSAAGAEQHDSLLEVSATFCGGGGGGSFTLTSPANQPRRPLVALDTGASCPEECNCAQVVELNCPLCSATGASGNLPSHEVSVTSSSSSSFATSGGDSFESRVTKSSGASQFSAQLELQHQAPREQQQRQQQQQQVAAQVANQQQISSSSSTSSGCCDASSANSGANSSAGQRITSSHCSPSGSSNSPSASSLLSSSSSSCGVRVTATDSSEDSSLDQQKSQLNREPNQEPQQEPLSAQDYGAEEARGADIMGLASSRQQQQQHQEQVAASNRDQQVRLNATKPEQQQDTEVEELISELELCKLGVCKCEENAKSSARFQFDQENSWLAAYDEIRSHQHLKQSPNFYQLAHTTSDNLVLPITTRAEVDPIFSLDPRDLTASTASNSQAAASRLPALEADQSSMVEATAKLVRVVSATSSRASSRASLLAGSSQLQVNSSNLIIRRQQVEPIYDVPSMFSLETSPPPPPNNADLSREPRCLSPDQKYPRKSADVISSSHGRQRQLPGQLVGKLASCNLKLDPSLSKWDGRGCPCAGCARRADRSTTTTTRQRGERHRKRKRHATMSRSSETGASCVAQFGSVDSANANRRQGVGRLRHESSGNRSLRAASRNLGADLEASESDCSCASDCHCSTCCSSETIVYISTNGHHDHHGKRQLDRRANSIRVSSLRRRHHNHHNHDHRTVASPITATSVCSRTSCATSGDSRSSLCSCSLATQSESSSLASSSFEEPGSLTEEYLRRHRSSRKSRRRLARLRRRFERHQHKRRRRQRHLALLRGHQPRHGHRDPLAGRSSRGGHGRPSVAPAAGFDWQLLEEDEAELMSPDSLAGAAAATGNGQQSDAATTVRLRPSKVAAANLISAGHANGGDQNDEDDDEMLRERNSLDAGATKSPDVAASGSQSGQHDDLREREFKATGQQQQQQHERSGRLVGDRRQDADLHGAARQRQAATASSPTARRREGDNYYGHSLQFATGAGGRVGSQFNVRSSPERQAQRQQQQQQQQQQQHRPQQLEPPELATSGVAGDGGNYRECDAKQHHTCERRRHHRRSASRHSHRHLAASGSTSGRHHRRRHRNHLLTPRRHTNKRVHRGVSSCNCRRCVARLAGETIASGHRCQLEPSTSGARRHHRHHTNHRHHSRSGHRHRRHHYNVSGSGEDFRFDDREPGDLLSPISMRQRKLISQLRRQLEARQHKHQVASGEGDPSEQRQLSANLMALGRDSRVLLRNRRELSAKLEHQRVSPRRRPDVGFGDEDSDLNADGETRARIAKNKFSLNKATLGRAKGRGRRPLGSTCSNGNGSSSLRTSLFGSRRQVGYYNHRHAGTGRSRRRISATLSQLQALQRELIASAASGRRSGSRRRNGRRSSKRATGNLASSYQRRSSGAARALDANDFSDDQFDDDDVDLAAGDFIQDERSDFMDKFLVKKLSPQIKGRPSKATGHRNREAKVRSPIGRLIAEMTKRKLSGREFGENANNISTGSLLNWQLAPRCQCSHCCLVDKLIARDVEAKRVRRLQRRQLKLN